MKSRQPLMGVIDKVGDDIGRHCGFEVTVRPASEMKLCPVSTPWCYMERTKYQRPADRSLFTAVNSPFAAISSKTVEGEF